ncbi:MAG: hypothetical protein ACI87J_002212 [Colwellia sp.]|jgi:hypothetical protein
MAMTDNACAELLQKERNKLFNPSFEHQDLYSTELSFIF